MERGPTIDATRGSDDLGDVSRASIALIACHTLAFPSDLDHSSSACAFPRTLHELRAMCSTAARQ